MYSIGVVIVNDTVLQAKKAVSIQMQVRTECFL